MNSRNFDLEFDEDSDTATLAQVGDLGPESIVYIPSGTPGVPGLLAVGNEVSGTTALYSVTPIYGVLP